MASRFTTHPMKPSQLHSYSTPARMIMVPHIAGQRQVLSSLHEQHDRPARAATERNTNSCWLEHTFVFACAHTQGATTAPVLMCYLYRASQI